MAATANDAGKVAETVVADAEVWICEILYHFFNTHADAGGTQ